MLTFNHGLNNVRDLSFPKLKMQLVDQQIDKKLVPNGVKCNDKRNWVSVLRLAQRSMSYVLCQSLKFPLVLFKKLAVSLTKLFSI